MDVIHQYPSLISCLTAEKSGFYLDPDFLTRDRFGEGTVGIGRRPFSKTMPARIKTDGGDRVQDVHLIMQRDQYARPDSLLPINNPAVDAAWQQAFLFHRQADHAKAPIFFEHQISPHGELQPFQALYHCQHSGQWFHPVCPQCGVALTLCRDDALLEKRGLPTYAGSLERFMYCRACAARSDASLFYARRKAAGMPASVHDAADLVAHWKHLLTRSPDQIGLPCRECSDMHACYKTESRVSGHMVPFAFFPFFMLVFPAPTYSGADFMTLISGAAAPESASCPTFSTVSERFLFQDQDRQFLEILYLKLTFMQQVCRQLFPADDPTGIQEVDLSLDSIGVDLHPAGVGLPAYWSFSVRILDAVGTFKLSPFAPIMPEAPCLHFLGALWFRTLLVNSRQQTDSVFTHVGQLVHQLSPDQGPETLSIDTADPLSLFAGNQIYWMPDSRRLPEKWQDYWRQTLCFGFQLVHAGLRTGVLWENGQFMDGLDALRKQVKDEMFSEPAMTSVDEWKPMRSDKMRMALCQILEKWRQEADPAASPPASEMQPQNTDLDETIVFAPPSSVPVSAWNNDAEKTVVITPQADAPLPEATASADDLDPTVIISRPPVDDDNLAATMVPSSPEALSTSSADPDEELEATVVISGPRPEASQQIAPSVDDDLAATLVQGTGDRPPASHHPPEPAPDPADDALAATLVQTPRRNDPFPEPTPPAPPQPPRDNPGLPALEDGDDEVMEQTVIIRSDKPNGKV